METKGPSAPFFDIAIFLAVVAIAVASYGLIDAYGRPASSTIDAVSLVLPKDDDRAGEILRGAKRAARDLKIPFAIVEADGDVSFEGDALGQGTRHDVYAAVNANAVSSDFAAGYVAVLSARTTTILAPFERRASDAKDEEPLLKNTAGEYLRVNFGDGI
jgi:hypothetical protein